MSIDSRTAARPGAFTLIELLVCVAIIAMLIGILVPVLAAARARGQRTMCATNLRQIQLAMRSYLDASNDVFPFASMLPSMDPGPPMGFDPPIYIADVLLPHAVGQEKIFDCPADAGQIDRGDPHGTRRYFDSEKSSYQYRPFLGGQSLKEVVDRIAEFSGRRIQPDSFWIMRDYDNFHNQAGKEGARRYVYNDGHVSDFED